MISRIHTIPEKSERSQYTNLDFIKCKRKENT